VHEVRQLCAEGKYSLTEDIAKRDYSPHGEVHKTAQKMGVALPAPGMG
jgi:hypothetical protein